MSAADLSHPTFSMEYTPLDPQASIGETKLEAEIPKNNSSSVGPVDYIANSRHDGDSW